MTQDLRIIQARKSILDHILEIISNPNVAFLLIIGISGILIEIFNFGLIVPGVAGLLSLSLAFIALGNLPVNWIGIGLIVMAAALIVLETQTNAWGLLATAGIICLVIGGLMIYNQSSGLTPVQVSLWILIPIAAAIAISLAGLAWLIGLSPRNDGIPGKPGLIGETGWVSSSLDPIGIIVTEEGTWSAVSQQGTPIPEGTRVRVVEVDELTLQVIPQQEG